MSKPEFEERLDGQQAIWMDLRRRFVPDLDSINTASKREMQGLIEVIVSNVDIYEPFPVSSHRRFLGPFIVFGKKTLQKILKLVIKIGFARQLALNENLLTVATLVGELQLQVAHLQKRVKQLEQAHNK